MSNFEDLLRPYYSRIFPYEPYIKWLNGGSVTQSDSLSKREFSFTLQDDIYLRYLSFSSASELREDSLSLGHHLAIQGIYYYRSTGQYVQALNLIAMNSRFQFLSQLFCTSHAKNNEMVFCRS